MKHALLGFLTLVSFAATGAIVENTNAIQTTFYYAIRGSQVTIRRCDAAPSSDLDTRQCQPVTSGRVTFDPIDLSLFERMAKAWAQSDLDAIAAHLTDLQGQLTHKTAELAEIDRLIQGLPPGSSALSDYQDRRRDTARQILDLNTQIATAQAQQNGYDLLFGANGYLAQDILHPIVDGASTYLAVRPYVSHFLEIFRYGTADPYQPVADARADFARFRAAGQRPYCAYWNGGFGDSDSLDSSREGIVRTVIALDRTEPFATARQSCQALGMQLPAAAHIPGYHSHLYDGEDRESWPVGKSTRLFAATDLAKGLPDFDYSGRKAKIFWVQILWTSAAHKPGDPDAFFLSPDGQWFAFNDGEDEGGSGIAAHSQPVDLGWNLSVVCEKEYPTVPRYIQSTELPDCTEYVGWP
jgi:hypothetical protein